jgi:hypothetical protein
MGWILRYGPDSVGDVLGVRRGEPLGSKEPGSPPALVFSADVFQICLVLALPQFQLAGRCQDSKPAKMDTAWLTDAGS